MWLHMFAFAVLVVAFTWGSVTAVNAGLIAIVAAFLVGTLAGDLTTKQVINQFPAGLFFILAGATLLFSIVRTTGTIDLLARWAEKATMGYRLLVPVLMFVLTAVLCTAGAFTPAAIAIVAPVALDLADRYGISRLAMGLTIVQGANAGAFSPVNPFGIVSNVMLAEAGREDGQLQLYLNCLAFNAVLAVLAYAVLQGVLGRGARTAAAAAADRDPGAPIRAAAVLDAPEHQPAPDDAAPLSTVVSPSAPPPATASDAPVEAVEEVRLTFMRGLTLAGLVALLVLTLWLGIDVGMAALIVALVLIAFRPSVQRAAFDLMPWPAIILVTGIVTYVGVLEEIGSVDFLRQQIERLGSGTLATLVTSYVVGVVSAFASTTGTLSAITPVVVPIASDPALSALGVITAISISSSVVDVSPMSTSGAILMTSARGGEERTFFRALLLWAVLMIGLIPGLAWAIFILL